MENKSAIIFKLKKPTAVLISLLLNISKEIKSEDRKFWRVWI